MEQRTSDPDHELERTGDELEERLEKLDDNIDESKQEARARSEKDADPFEAGDDDWDEDDEEGDGDPAGFDDPEADEDDEEEDF